MTNFEYHPKTKIKSNNNNTSIILTAILSLIAGISLVSFEFARAETGTGTDIFKVVLTIIGADKEKTGDLIALVTVNDHSKVKFFELKNTTSNNLIEYVATFPNVTVSSGDTFNACILPLKNLKIVCTTGHNSPAKRPEFVDMSLNSTKLNPPHDVSTEAVTVTNQSSQLSSGLNNSNIDSSADTEKQHKKKKSDKVDETANSILDPAFNIDQNPLR